MPDDNNNPNPINPTYPANDPGNSPSQNPGNSDPYTPVSTPPKPVVEETPTIEAPTFPSSSDDIPPPPMAPTTNLPPNPPGEEPEESTNTDTATDMGLPPVISTSGKPKKKGGRRVIATILGLFLLVGAVGAGVVLVQRNQDVREKAEIKLCSGTSDSVCKFKNQGTSCGASGGTCQPNGKKDSVNADICTCKVPTTTTSGGSNTGPVTCQKSGSCGGAGGATECSKDEKCAYDSSVGRPICKKDASCPADEGGTSCILNGGCLEGVKDVCCNLKSYSDTTCKTPINKRCGTAPTTPPPPDDGKNKSCVRACNGTDCNKTPAGCSPITSSSCTTDADCGASKPPPPTTPPSKDVTAQCMNIRAFDTDWNELSTTELGELRVGDSVRFTVAGTTNSGTIGKARFIINGVTRAAVTQKRPGSNEFYDEYIIPEGTTSFSIRAQLNHSTAGWF